MAVDTVSGCLNGLVVIVEVHTFVSAGNVFISCEKSSDIDKIDVTVKRDRLIISTVKHNDVSGRLALISPVDLFCPSSCCNLSGSIFTLPTEGDEISNCEYVLHSPVYNSNLLSENNTCDAEKSSVNYEKTVHSIVPAIEIAFRLQTKTLKNLSAVSVHHNFHRNYFSDATNYERKHVSVNRNDFEINVPYLLYCTACKYKLSETAVLFQKVLVLPSNLSELSEDWFCHKHTESEGTPSFIPQANELYTSLTHYHLHHSNLANVYNAKNNSLVRCKRCLCILGERKQSKTVTEIEYMEIFRSKIVFRHENETSMKTMPEEICDGIDTLKVLIENSLQNTLTCKICLETRISESEGMCLLLWILDRNLSRFFLQKPFHAALDATEVLCMNDVIKVLYGITARNSSQARSWRHDFSVDVHEVSDKLMMTITEILMQSSRTVPNSQRIVDNLLIGYLPLEKE